MLARFIRRMRYTTMLIFMETIKKKLGIFKEVLVYAYIWQIPFSWRWIIDPSRSQANPVFNEYMDISLYLGEVLLVIALAIHILEYIISEKSILSINTRWNWRNMFHVEHILGIAAILILFGINLAASIDILLSLTSIAHWVSLLAFLYLFNQIYVPRGTRFIKSLIFIFFVSILFQFIVAVLQVLGGSSLGLWFLNESVLSTKGLNVAKSHIFSEVSLRGYGTFPHPNVLAAYAMSLIIFAQFCIDKMFHVKHLFHVEHFFIRAIQILSGVTILLTQSKLCIVFATLYVSYLIMRRYDLKKTFHVEQISLLGSVVFIAIIIGYFVFHQEIHTSFQTRIDQYRFQNENFEVSTYGTGIGTYRLSYDGDENKWWTYEPVHFVPLIAVKELGFLMSLLVIAVVAVHVSSVPRGTFYKIMGPGMFLLFILLTDHYVWDIYQGMFIGVFLLAIIYSIDKKVFILHKSTLEK